MNFVITRSIISQGKQITRINLPSMQSGQRYISKHWNPKFRRLRREKFLKVELPDFEKLRADQKLSTEELRSKMKEKGISPPRPWMEKPIFISSTPTIFEPFIPPEGDGKISIVSKEGAKQRMQELAKKGSSYMSIRKIRQFEEDFDVASMAEQAQEIYVKAQKALVNKDEDELHLLVTEKCYPEMIHNTNIKTIRWSFLGSIEPPRVVQVKHTDMLTKENVFAQTTVRMHTQQTLAIYDRFGRLEYGSEVIVKDVLEYVVFEKHLANLYGTWRIHGKIIPDWLPARSAISKTYVKKQNIANEIVETKVVKTDDKNDNIQKQETSVITA